MEETEALDVPSVFAACGRAWVFGSFTALPLIFLWFVVSEPIELKLPGLFDLVGFGMMVVAFTWAVAVFSIPYMLIAALPLALIVARFKCRSMILNGILGGAIGALVGYLIPLSFVPPGWFLAALAVPYGAFTGFFVTRMRYG